MIEYSSEINNLHFFIEYTRSYAMEAGFTDSDINQIELAVEESIFNIISYAFPEKKGLIQLKCEVRKNSLTVIISDCGVPFNLLEHTDPDINIPVEEREVGGLGILLIKKMVDKVNYEHINNYNILTLKKYLIAKV